MEDAWPRDARPCHPGRPPVRARSAAAAAGSSGNDDFARKGPDAEKEDQNRNVQQTSQHAHSCVPFPCIAIPPPRPRSVNRLRCSGDRLQETRFWSRLVFRAQGGPNRAASPSPASQAARHDRYSRPSRSSTAWPGHFYYGSGFPGVSTVLCFSIARQPFQRSLNSHPVRGVSVAPLWPM